MVFPRCYLGPLDGYPVGCKQPTDGQAEWLETWPGFRATMRQIHLYHFSQDRDCWLFVRSALKTEFQEATK